MLEKVAHIEKAQAALNREFAKAANEHNRYSRAVYATQANVEHQDKALASLQRDLCKHGNNTLDTQAATAVLCIGVGFGSLHLFAFALAVDLYCIVVAL